MNPELIVKAEEELRESPPVVDENGRFSFGPHFRRLLLHQARKSQKGRRGLSSRKRRVQKKILQKELELMIKDYVDNYEES